MSAVKSTEERRRNLFHAIVREYLKSAQPVGSESIVSKYRLRVSPATTRNDMAELERLGFLAQPHTSAGRVPTEKGYRFYVEQFVEPDVLKSEETSLSARAQKKLAEALSAAELEDDFEAQHLARLIASLTAETVFVSFSRRLAAFSGIANLLQKPEFQDIQELSVISQTLDDFELVFEKAAKMMSEDIEILIGDENPFGKTLSVVLVRFETPTRGGVIGILGPTRMDYETNAALAKCVRELLHSDI